MKKLFKNILIWWNRLCGRPCIVNHKSKEVHDTGNAHKNCHLTEIKDFDFMTRKNAEYLIEMAAGYNGCRWCNKKNDTDLKRK